MIANGWTRTTIGQQVHLQRGYDITKVEQRPGMVPVVSSAGVLSYHDTAKAPGPGVVIGRKSNSIARSYFVKTEYWPHDTSLWVTDFRGNDPRFVYYFFQNLYPRMVLFDVGSANPTLNRNHIHPIQVAWPPVNEQRSISQLLGTIDDKIDLNRRMNETLEAIARALFRSWFMDFDPVRAKAEGRQPAGLAAETAALFPDELGESPIGLVPSGWAIDSMEDHVEVAKGLSYKGSGLAESGLPLHNLNSIFEGGGYKHAGIKYYAGEYKERHVIRPGDVIVANTEQGFDYLLIGYPAIVPKRYGDFGLFTHHTYRVRPLPNSPLTPRYLYLAFFDPRLREEVVGCTNGTTVNMLAADGLKRPRLLVPLQPIVGEFDAIVCPILGKIEANDEQSRTLAALRDALLPMLLSGEIRVKDVEAARSEVGFQSVISNS